MKAIAQERYGPPDTLQLADLDVPRPGPDEVLLRVHAAAVNPYDWHVVRGDPYVARLMGGTGLRRPRSRVAGVDAAGTVVDVGADVRTVRPGDEVLGFADGAFAEFALAAAGLMVPKPSGLTFEEAAALPLAATTALRGIRDVGEVGPGSRVLVTGAGGGIGTFAIQIAAALGADVTGVCGPEKVELVRSLGAADAVDYTSRDFTDVGDPYTVILDSAGSTPLSRLRRALTPNGILVLNDGGSPGHLFGAVGTMLRGALVNGVVGQRIRILPTKKDRSELLALRELVDDGSLRPVIGRTYPLADTAEAVRHIEHGHALGKVVITVP
jgi:NADPH:quinone reductase-like Zn-dependent oxidoreductase